MPARTSTLERVDDDMEMTAAVATNGVEPHDDDDDDARYMTSADLFAMSDRTVEKVTIPEWVDDNGKKMRFFLHSLDASERDKYLNSIQYTDKRGRQRYDLDGSSSRLVSLSARDNNGNLIFRGTDGMRWLQRRNAAVVERIARHVRNISGLNQDDDEETEKRREG